MLTPVHQKIYDAIESACKGDWNSRRSRIFITCKLAESEKQIRNLREALKIESLVHKRVEAALARRERMIPGLKHYNETGDTSLMEECLELDKDDLRILVESAYYILQEYAQMCNEQGQPREDVNDWLAVAKRELEEGSE